MFPYKYKKYLKKKKSMDSVETEIPEVVNSLWKAPCRPALGVVWNLNEFYGVKRSLEL